jgi:hypothetical protein
MSKKFFTDLVGSRVTAKHMLYTVTGTVRAAWVDDDQLVLVISDEACHGKLVTVGASECNIETRV